jgi:Tol biopolymer transport system component
LLFAGDRGSGWALYTLSRRIRQVERLTKDLPARMYVRYPEWSPDGKHIAYEFNESKGNVFLAELQ